MDRSKSLSSSLSSPSSSRKRTSTGDEGAKDDWIDRVCDRATGMCPIPKNLPPEAFATSPTPEDEDILDHVFEGMERTLSLTTATRVEDAQAKQKKEQGASDESSIVSCSSPRSEQKDALDEAFERIESWTCGAISDIEAPARRKMSNSVEDCAYITKEELGSQKGVRFRDTKSLLTPEPSLGYLQDFIPKSKWRWALRSAAFALALLCVLTGIVLIIKA